MFWSLPCLSADTDVHSHIWLLGGFANSKYSCLWGTCFVNWAISPDLKVSFSYIIFYLFFEDFTHVHKIFWSNPLSTSPLQFFWTSLQQDCLPTSYSLFIFYIFEIRNRFFSHTIHPDQFPLLEVCHHSSPLDPFPLPHFPSEKSRP